MNYGRVSFTVKKRRISSSIRLPLCREDLAGARILAIGDRSKSTALWKVIPEVYRVAQLFSISGPFYQAVIPEEQHTRGGGQRNR